MNKTVRKIVCVVLVALMCITAAPLDCLGSLSLTASALPGPSSSIPYETLGENITHTVDNETGEVVVTGEGKTYNCDMTIFQSPFNVNADEELSKNIKSIIIKDGITSIGTYLFYYCASLKKIVIPSTVTSIAVNAFYGCNSFEDIYFTGTKEQWEKITIDGTFDEDITIHCASTRNCKGYICDDCGDAYGEGDDSHVWNNWGHCNVCYNQCSRFAEHSTMDENCPICGYSRFTVELISGNTTKKYTGFDEAAADAKEGDTIKLLKDTAPFASGYTINKAVVFDINGHGFDQSGSEYITVNANVTFIDSSEEKTGYLGWGIIANSLCTFESGAYRYIMNQTDSKYADFLPKCANFYLKEADRIIDFETESFYGGDQIIIKYSHDFGETTEKAATCTEDGYSYKQCNTCSKYFAGDAKVDAINGKDNSDSFVIKAGHIDGNDRRCNVCDRCYTYIGDVYLKVGENEVPISNPISNDYFISYFVVFIPNETREYVFTSKGATDSARIVLYPDGFTKEAGSTVVADNNIYDGKNEFELKYHLEKGKEYFIYFFASGENNNFTVTVSKGCLHSGTQQDCAGYICDACQKHFGEGDSTKHNYKSNGYCSLCGKAHDHTAFDETGKCTGCPYVAPFLVTTDGKSSAYTDFSKALEACKDSSVIKILNDKMCLDNYYIEKAITLDLNGHNLSQPSSYNLYIKANATLTDSVGGGVCQFRIYIYSPCTISGGIYSDTVLTYEENAVLSDYLAPCCEYYKAVWTWNNEIQKIEYLIGEKVDLTTSDSSAVLAVKPTHSFGETMTKDATCTEDGYNYKQCNTCSKYFSTDAKVDVLDGKDSSDSFKIKANGHSYKGVIINNGDGTHSFKCVNGCETYGNAAAHTWDNGKVTKDATHLKEGTMTYTCSCGATKDEPIEKLKEHTYVETVVAPTCTQDGYTEHKCACGDSYKDAYISAKHNFENGSCTECGAADPNYKGEDNSGNNGDNNGSDISDCDCICHNSSKFVQFVYKIVRVFWKLFKIHGTCDCGAVHY